eukprot:1137357-Pelagomonas_calceolata.AAC.2
MTSSTRKLKNAQRNDEFRILRTSDVYNLQTSSLKHVCYIAIRVPPARAGSGCTCHVKHRERKTY